MTVETSRLTYEFAQEHTAELVDLVGLAVRTNNTTGYLFAERLDGGTPIHGKWDHSLVARQGGDIAGLALVYERPSGPKPLYAWDEMHLGILAVSEDKQGKGVGSALMREMVAAALARPSFLHLDGTIDYLGMTVDYDNHRARGLYESFGFEDVTEEVPAEDTVSLRTMRATLTAAARSSAFTALKG